VRVRNATPEDEGFVRDLAGEVFAPFGDYRPLLPKWFRISGVLTFVAEHDGTRTGYVMLAFFRDGENLVGDVLAIAVVPEFQNQGIGRTLLEHVIDVCEEMAERSAVTAIRLSVAATNDRARHLFGSCGFREVPGEFGSYEGGQKALHMERPVGNAGS